MKLKVNLKICHYTDKICPQDPEGEYHTFQYFAKTKTVNTDSLNHKL